MRLLPSCTPRNRKRRMRMSKDEYKAEWVKKNPDAEVHYVKAETPKEYLSIVEKIKEKLRAEGKYENISESDK